MKSAHTTAVGMPGRNMCNFLCAFNFSVWLIVTFECQNINSSMLSEEDVRRVVGYVSRHSGCCLQLYMVHAKHGL